MTARLRLPDRSASERDDVILLALDPGLDECGWALLSPALPRPALLGVGTWDCPPGATLEARMHRHHRELGRVLATGRSVIAEAPEIAGPVTHAVIERPITSTVYAAHRHGERQQTKMAHSREVQELVTGALWAFCVGHGLRALYAAPTPKRLRSLDLLGRLFPQLPRTSEHARAALALGLAALSDHRRIWDAATT